MSNHDSFGPYCPICGAEMQRETCNGKGGYWECPAVSHTDAQIAKYNEPVLRDMPK